MLGPDIAAEQQANQTFIRLKDREARQCERHDEKPRTARRKPPNTAYAKLFDVANITARITAIRR